SFSGRVWFKPSDQWELQVSSGRLEDPEELERGQNIVRTTASASWTRIDGGSIAAVTAAIGANRTDHGARGAFLIEGARHNGLYTLFGRVETVQVETGLLLTDIVVEGAAAHVKNTVTQLTLGAVRDVLTWRGFEGGFGADITAYGVPDAL